MIIWFPAEGQITVLTTFCQSFSFCARFKLPTVFKKESKKERK